jgi:hypothetical protein
MRSVPVFASAHFDLLRKGYIRERHNISAIETALSPDFRLNCRRSFVVRLFILMTGAGVRRQQTNETQKTKTDEGQ